MADPDADRGEGVLSVAGDQEAGERDEELQLPPGPLVCPECESPNVRRRPRALYFGVIAMFAIAIGIATDQTEVAFFLVGASAIFALISDRFICSDCGESWK